MTLSYIILAHKEPHQVVRLIKRLSDIDVYFYIHIDKNVEISEFNIIEVSQYIYILNDSQRVESPWGDFGAVQATVNAMRQVLTDGRKGYCILLSGQDYPIRDNRLIKEFFSLNNGINFIFGEPVPGNLAQDFIERFRFLQDKFIQ